MRARAKLIEANNPCEPLVALAVSKVRRHIALAKARAAASVIASNGTPEQRMAAGNVLLRLVQD